MVLTRTDVAGSTPTLFYRRPLTAPGTVTWARRLLLVNAVASIVSMLSLLQMVMPALQVAQDLGATLLADATPATRDAGRILSGLAGLAGVALVGTAVYLPVRSLLLARAVKRGHPATWRSIRRLAVLQIVLELARLFLVSALGADLEATTLKTAPGLHLLLGPALLVLMSRPATKAFFTHHAVAHDGPFPFEAPAPPPFVASHATSTATAHGSQQPPRPPG